MLAWQKLVLIRQSHPHTLKLKLFVRVTAYQRAGGEKSTGFCTTVLT